MSKFYYIIHSTTGDNVFNLNAKDQAEAKQKIAEIFGDSIFDPKVDTLSVEFIGKGRAIAEAKRIQEARATEATANPENN